MTIKLSNVGKEYISKSKQRVVALKDISLEIDGHGMVFVLGKSGSGKSTLLNLLGGMDSVTSGDITVADASFATFKRADYENYRNQYVGFVFQDFNLLHELDVRGNVALALQLSDKSEITEKVTAALNEVGLDSEYLSRRINELSGGEKQRVAIARAIVKDSPVILADEPTGNLDTETSDGIWKIFKKLAETKTVVIVTHDRDSAEQYSDRIIKISDGKIVSDSIVREADTASENSASLSTENEIDCARTPSGDNPPTAAKKRRLPISVCFKLGVNSLLKRKLRTFFVLLVSLLTIFGVAVAQVINTYSSEKAIARFVTENGVDYIALAQGRLIYGNEFDGGFIMKPSTKRYIAKHAKYMDLTIKSRDDITNIGLTFIGDSLEIDDYSFYFTSQGLENAYKDFYCKIMVDGESRKLFKDDFPPETLAGKKIQLSRYDDFYTCAGVVDTSKCSPYTDGLFPSYFTTADFGDPDWQHIININYDDRFPEVLCRFGNAKYSGPIEMDKPAKLGERIITSDGLKNAQDFNLADDEFILTYELYAKIFGAKSKSSYVSSDLMHIIELPERLDETFRIKFSTYGGDEMLADVGDRKLVGVAVTAYDCVDDMSCMKSSFGMKTARTISLAFNDCRVVIVSTSSVKDLTDFLVEFRDDHTGYVGHAGLFKEEYTEVINGVTTYSSSTYNIALNAYLYEHNVYEFKIIFWGVAALLSLIFVLVIINLVSFSISSRKKEIGVLSALGTSRGDLYKIFIFETLVISAITFVLGLIGAVVTAHVLSSIYTLADTITIPLFGVDFLTVLVLIGASTVLPLLAMLVPLRKIVKMRPIDAIKNM